MRQDEYAKRLKADMAKVGPKRDDHRRQAALLMAGRKNQQAKKRAEHELKAMQVKVGAYVRVVISGKTIKQGEVVGECGSQWLVRTTTSTRYYAKGHCEKIKTGETSKAIRHREVMEVIVPKAGVYGDGDI